MNDLVRAAIPDCVALATSLANQPDFFAGHREELPDSRSTLPDLGSPRYTGDRSDDEATNLRVGAMRMLGMSDRSIERECGVDRRTIPHRLNWLETTRRIPALKDRLSQRTGQIAESSALVLGVLLDRAGGGEVTAELAAMIKAVATAHGITVEKMQLLTGGATERIVHVAGDGRRQTEEFMRDLASVVVEVASVAVEVLPVESESPDPSQNPQQIAPAPDGECGLSAADGGSRPGSDGAGGGAGAGLGLETPMHETGSKNL